MLDYAYAPNTPQARTKRVTLPDGTTIEVGGALADELLKAMGGAGPGVDSGLGILPGANAAPANQFAMNGATDAPTFANAHAKVPGRSVSPVPEFLKPLAPPSSGAGDLTSAMLKLGKAAGGAFGGPDIPAAVGADTLQAPGLADFTVNGQPSGIDMASALGTIDAPQPAQGGWFDDMFGGIGDFLGMGGESHPQADATGVSDQQKTEGTWLERMNKNPLAMALMMGGLNTMVAASRPGATALGSIGEGALGAVSYESSRESAQADAATKAQEYADTLAEKNRQAEFEGRRVTVEENRAAEDARYHAASLRQGGSQQPLETIADPTSPTGQRYVRRGDAIGQPAPRKMSLEEMMLGVAAGGGFTPGGAPGAGLVDTPGKNGVPNAPPPAATTKPAQPPPARKPQQPVQLSQEQTMRLAQAKGALAQGAPRSKVEELLKKYRVDPSLLGQ